MRFLYFCNSAYQLINTLNLHKHHQSGFEEYSEYSADLIVQNSFDKADRIVETIDRNGIFEHAWLFNKSVNKGNLHILNSLRNIAFPSWNLEKNYGFQIEDLKNRYDAIVVPKFAPVIAAIWQINPNAELFLQEDGAGSYFAYFDMEMRSKSYKVLYKFFNHGRDFYDYKKIYINCPEFYFREDRELIVKIPEFEEDDLKQIADILGAAETEEETGKDIFWFSQKVSDDKSKENFESDEALDYLKQYKERVLYFPHPRFPYGTEGFDQPEKEQIWEIRVLNLENISHDVIISIHSTACLTPKILFDKEPYVILLYKIVIRHDWPYFEMMDRVISAFKSSYIEPSKVMIPETIEEYRRMIDDFVEQNVTV